MFVFSRLSQVGNSADSGIVAGSEHDAYTYTVGAVCSKKGHVWGLKDVHMGLVRFSEELLCLSSERSIVYLQLVGGKQDNISWNLVTTSNLDDITGY